MRVVLDLIFQRRSSGAKAYITLNYTYSTALPQLGDTIDVAINSHTSGSQLSADLVTIHSSSSDNQQHASTSRAQLLSILNGRLVAF